MCGRFAMDDTVDALIEEFVLATGKGPQEWTPSWNIAPTDDIPVLFASKRESGVENRFEVGHWSLVPSFSKTLKTTYPTFNARTEGITEKASWRKPIRSQRAIIPALGYYEWQGEKGHKTPYFIRDPHDDVLGLAGMYSWWRDPTKADDDPDKWRLTATILTSDAVETLADIHDRNPVILPRELWQHWIDPTVVGDQALVDEAVRAGVAQASTLEYYEVGPVRDNGPELIEPVGPRSALPSS
ncbi:SOS response-associated peptidase [Humibacter soli]